MPVMTKKPASDRPSPHAFGQKTVAEQVERRRIEKGMNRRQLSVAAGLNPRYVRDLVERGKQPQANALQAIAKVLRCAVEDLQRTPDEAYRRRSPGQLRAARFRAARWACWEQPRDAARQLGIGVTELTSMEAGFTPVPDEFLVLFAGLTGCPLGWLKEGGRLDKVPGEMAARIVFFDPELLPKRDED